MLMKRIIITITALISFGAINFSFSQRINHDSIGTVLKSSKDNRERLDHLARFVWRIMWSFPDSALPYVQQEILLAKEVKQDSALSIALTQGGVRSYLAGNFPEAIRFCLEGLQAAERSTKVNAIGVVCHYLTEIYIDAGDYERGIFYSNKSKLLYESTNQVVSVRCFNIRFLFLGLCRCQ